MYIAMSMSCPSLNAAFILSRSRVYHEAHGRSIRGRIRFEKELPKQCVTNCSKQTIESLAGQHGNPVSSESFKWPIKKIFSSVRGGEDGELCKSRVFLARV